MCICRIRSVKLSRSESSCRVFLGNNTENDSYVQIMRDDECHHKECTSYCLNQCFPVRKRYMASGNAPLLNASEWSRGRRLRKGDWIQQIKMPFIVY